MMTLKFISTQKIATSSKVTSKAIPLSVSPQFPSRGCQSQHDNKTKHFAWESEERRVNTHGLAWWKWGPPRATRCSKPALATTFAGYNLACILIDSYPCYFVLMPFHYLDPQKVSQRSSKCLRACLQRTLFLSSLSSPRRIWWNPAIRGRWLIMIANPNRVCRPSSS